MKAIVLSAGRGTRLLPWTTEIPKCLLTVDGERSLLEVQLSTLAECGIEEAVVMTGFGAERVEEFVARTSFPGMHVRTSYNPFFDTADNLVTCWLARNEMHGDFVLLNGDTLFDRIVLSYLLASASAPLTLAVDEKAEYDDDDMKVSLFGRRRLRAVGKTLDPDITDAESIGLMVFREDGPETFRSALEDAVRRKDSSAKWYLSVVGTMAEYARVEVAPITGFWWGEVDSPSDLASVRADLSRSGRKAAPLTSGAPLVAHG